MSDQCPWCVCGRNLDYDGEQPCCLFVRGYFFDRTAAGDRLDPATGKVININPKD